MHASPEITGTQQEGTWKDYKSIKVNGVLQIQQEKETREPSEGKIS